jgi:hypothetical protein
MGKRSRRKLRKIERNSSQSQERRKDVPAFVVDGIEEEPETRD